MKNVNIVYPNKQSIADILNKQVDVTIDLIENNDSQNQLYYGDNLRLLYYLYNLKKQNNFEGIDLIYIDPPFMTGKKFKNKNDELCYYDTLEDDQYLEFLRMRLILMREILKETGSIYVHLDWHAGHYVKVMMDEIFGEKNFRNEIIWCYAGREAPVKYKFSRKHDSILYYTKTDNYVFNVEYEPYDENYVKLYFTHKDECGRFFQWQPDGKGGRYKQYLDKSKGIPLRDWWEIKPVHGVDYMKRNETKREWQGYLNQKPEALLERIVKVSSNEGNFVADFFCGSGTTLAVAEKLGRRWIGCDNSKLPIKITKDRLNKQYIGYNFYGTKCYNFYEIK